MKTHLKDQVAEFLEKDGLVLGICNGFQVLVKNGLLPSGTMDGEQTVTLTNNDSGHLECRPINLRFEETHRCEFLQGLEGVVTYPVAHGEGKFYADDTQLDEIEKQGLVVFRYVNGQGNPTQIYPENPNGSFRAIAGMTDRTGRILGLMPHPERAVDRTQYVNWGRNSTLQPQGLIIFERIVKYTK